MKRKIAFHLNCLEQGGAERVVTNLANQFSQEGYEVLIATEWYGENEFQIDERIRRVHVGLSEQDEKKSRKKQFFLRVKYLRNFMKSEKPDVLIAFAQRANYRALMASFGTRVPVVISIRTNPIGHYDSLADKLQIPFLFPRAAGCVFQTEGQRDYFAPYLQKNSKVILNPLNDKYIGVAKPEKREKVIVQSARLVGFKNQPMLLRAFVEVHHKHPDYILKIYGGDSFDGTKQKLEKIIEENQASAYIQLMGASDSLEKDLVNATAFAFSSDWEGLPNALLEAMALGLPIVATDCPCGGPHTVMQDGVNGLLIPIKNQKALEEGMNKLIENPEYAEALGENARKICEIANGKAIFESWQSYIEEICNK